MNDKLICAIKSNNAIDNIWQSIILSGYRGSMAHGTGGDVCDDIDILGVFISPINHYFGLTELNHINNVCVNELYDFALYEIKKYFKLLLKSNPAVLSLLWLPENLHITKNEYGQSLINNRSIFMSKSIFKSFGGFAYSQYRRMTHICTDKAFQGSKRRERYKKFGYDCKNASHTVRILKMGIEALSTGELNVVRHDAQLLCDIKQGKWSKEQACDEIKRLQDLLDNAFVCSTLKDKPDYKKAEKLLINILSYSFG